MTRLPRGATPQGDGPWEFRGKARPPGLQRQRGLAQSRRKGMKQRFFDNAARKLRVGAGDTLFAYVYMDSAKPAQGADASVAHQGELVAPRLLG